MSRIENCFAGLKAAGRKALIPYVTAGDPDPEVTPSLMHSLVEAGADIIELGVPFSDPMADGPVIQLACERALAKGTRLVDVLSMVAEFRQTDSRTPVVLMGYLNPIEAMGTDVFVEAAWSAGVDAVLTVDLPPEEAEPLNKALRCKGLDSIFLLSPTTSEKRIEHACALASGYLYYVSVKGVTGSSALNVDEVRTGVERIRQYTDLPLSVGFGIRDATSAAAVAAVCDGVIVGSLLVNRIGELAESPEEVPAAVAALVADLRRGLDGGA